jgi:tetratricopeptide (TPR) repeat protein
VSTQLTLLFLLVVLVAAPAGAAIDQPAATEPALPAEVWVRAKAAYEASDYAAAIELYGSLLEQGHDGGHLHYNLGNSYLRNGELGRAIASYLRGQARLPRDEDLRANLEFARQSARDAISPPRPPPLLSTLFFWHFNLSRAELAWLVVALNLLLWSGLGLRLWRRELPGSGGAVVLLSVLLLGSGGSLLARHLWPARTDRTPTPSPGSSSMPAARYGCAAGATAGYASPCQEANRAGSRATGPKSSRSDLRLVLVARGLQLAAQSLHLAAELLPLFSP